MKSSQAYLAGVVLEDNIAAQERAQSRLELRGISDTNTWSIDSISSSVFKANRKEGQQNESVTILIDVPALLQLTGTDGHGLGCACDKMSRAGQASPHSSGISRHVPEVVISTVKSAILIDILVLHCNVGSVMHLQDMWHIMAGHSLPPARAITCCKEAVRITNKKLTNYETQGSW